MNPYRANHIGVAVLTLILCATPAASQVERTHKADWLPGPSALGHRPAVLADDRNPALFLTTTGLASVGSVIGFFAGFALVDGPAADDDYGSALIGGGFGSNVGAVTAAGLMNGQWYRTVLGSFTGMALGALLGGAVGEGSGHGWMGVATYGLTHGLFTTIIGGS